MAKRGRPNKGQERKNNSGDNTVSAQSLETKQVTGQERKEKMHYPEKDLLQIAASIMGGLIAKNGLASDEKGRSVICKIAIDQAMRLVQEAKKLPGREGVK